MDLKLNRLQHIGLPVTDLEASQTFYGRLGFQPAMRASFAHEGGQGQVAMLRHADLTLELYQLPEPELTRVRQRTNGHIDHFAFDVDDIDATYALLQREGFTPLEPAPVFLPFWEKGCRYFNILGPDGERVEFCQIL